VGGKSFMLYLLAAANIPYLCKTHNSITFLL